MDSAWNLEHFGYRIDYCEKLYLECYFLW